jgi:hypothetical protein
LKNKEIIIVDRSEEKKTRRLAIQNLGKSISRHSEKLAMNEENPDKNCN